MLRSFFIYLSKASWARQIVTRWSVAWRMASRFVAGETLAEAIEVIRKLNDKGIHATLDQLGEHTTTPDEARQATQGILAILDVIEASGVRANVSIKLTQIGLALARQLCAENLQTILQHAQKYGNFVRIDMEDSPVTQMTLDLLFEMRQRGFENVGIVIQSYLYRSEKDIQKLIEAGIPVRLCKGAYKEPAEVAFPKKKDVDANYDRLAAKLIDGSLALNAPRLRQNGRIPPLPALATHDARRIQFAKDYAQKVKLPKDALEFQMLHGIRRDLQEELAAQGYPVRVYVPFGTQWYPYFMRRLAERPANVWFIVSNFFRR